MEVHRELGPGLLESVYQSCMAMELRTRGVRFERQVQVPILYKGTRLDSSLRMDLLVEGMVVVELKAMAALDRIHVAQILTYLKLTGHNVGLIINVNVPLLKNGIRRVVLGLKE